jgi:hypothetical protein
VTIPEAPQQRGLACLPGAVEEHDAEDRQVLLGKRTTGAGQVDLYHGGSCSERLWGGVDGHFTAARTDT